MFDQVDKLGGRYPKIAESHKKMSNEPNIPKDRALVKISPRTNALVEENLPDASEQAKQETKELIEVMMHKAFSEMQKVGDLALESYLAAVRSMRSEIEQLDIFNPEQIEDALWLMQIDARRNWESWTREMQELSDRLSEAAQAAWQILTDPRPRSR